VIAAVTAWSCKGTAPSGPDGSPSTIVFPPNNVSYSAQVQPLFDQACNSTSCHGSGTQTNPLVLASYGQAVLTIPGIVVPSKSSSSVLVLRIQGSVGARMPPGQYPLNQNQIDGIRTWIAEGAKDN
jgi:hypothetical protein